MSDCMLDPQNVSADSGCFLEYNKQILEILSEMLKSMQINIKGSLSFDDCEDNTIAQRLNEVKTKNNLLMKKFLEAFTSFNDNGRAYKQEFAQLKEKSSYLLSAIHSIQQLCEEIESKYGIDKQSDHIENGHSCRNFAKFTELYLEIEKLQNDKQLESIELERVKTEMNELNENYKRIQLEKNEIEKILNQKIAEKNELMQLFDKRIKNYNKEVSILTKKIRNIEKNKSELSEQIENLKHENDKYVSEIEELKVTNKKSKEMIVELEDENEKMTQKFADSDVNLKQLNQQLNDMKIKLDDQIKYKEKLETEIIRVRSEKENFEAECETLRQRITSQETLAEQLEFYKDVEKQNQELRNKQFLADANLVNLQIRLVEYEKMTQKFADSDENIKQLNQQLNDMKIKLNDQIKYKEKSETEIIRVRSEKENFEAECETLRQRITSQETLAEQSEFYKDVEKQNQELRNKQFLADGNLVDLQIRLVEYEKMTQKLADSDENLKQLNQQLNDMKIKLNDHIKYKERLETEIIRVRSEKENFEAECETLKQRITSQETLAEQLEFYKDVEKQNQELRNKQFLADANLVDLQIRLVEYEKMTQKLADSDENLKQLNQQFNDMKIKLNDQIKYKEKSETEIIRVRSEKENFEAECETLRQRITSQETLAEQLEFYKDVEKQNQELRNKQFLADANLVDLQIRLVEYEKMTQKLADSDENLKQLNQQLNDMKIKLNDHIKYKERLETEIIRVRSEKENFEAECETLKQRITSQETLAEQLEFYKDVEKQNQELRNKQFLADANLVDLQIRLVEYEKMTQKFADSDENIKQLNQQLNDMKIKLNDQIKYKEKSETEIIRVRSEKENFEAECETLRQRITSQETLAEQSEFYKDVEKQNQELRNKQFLADGNLVDLQIRLVEYEKMTQKLADSDENLKQLNQQFNDMKIKLDDQIKYKEKLETEIIRVRSEKENFEAECETLKQRITSQETLAEQLEFYKDVEKQNQELRNKQFLADGNLVDLQIRLVEYEKMTQKLADSDENLKQLNQQFNDMKIKLDDQIKYKEKLETEIIRVRSEKENFEAECETLKQRITSQETLAEQLEFYKDVEKQNQELRNKQFLADANLVDLQIRLVEYEKMTQKFADSDENIKQLNQQLNDMKIKLNDQIKYKEKSETEIIRVRSEKENFEAECETLRQRITSQETLAEQLEFYKDVEKQNQELRNKQFLADANLVDLQIRLVEYEKMTQKLADSDENLKQLNQQFNDMKIKLNDQIKYKEKSETEIIRVRSEKENFEAECETLRQRITSQETLAEQLEFYKDVEKQNQELRNKQFLADGNLVDLQIRLVEYEKMTQKLADSDENLKQLNQQLNDMKIKLNDQIKYKERLETEIIRVRSEKENFEAECETLRQRITSQETLAEQSEFYKDVEKQNQELRNKQFLADGNLVDLQIRLVEYEKMTQKLADSDENLKQLNQQFNDMKIKLDDQIKYKEKLETEIIRVRSEKENFEAECETLKQRITSQETLAEQLEFYKDVEKQNQELRNKQFLADANLVDLQIRLVEYEKMTQKFADSDENIKQLNQQLNDMKIKLNDQIKYKEKSETEIIRVRSEKENFEAECETLRQRITSQETLAEQLEFYKDVEKQNQELRNKQFLADANLVDLQIRLVEYEKMTQKLADSDENLKQLNQQFNDMKIKLNDQIKYKEKSETEIIRVRSEKENFEAECETLRQRITSQETLAEQLEFYKDVEKQNQELRNKQFLADGNLVDLQIRLVEYEKMTQKLADSDENLKQLNQQLNDMKIKLNDQIKYKERLETEIIRVRSEKENFEAECETLRQRITSQETLAEQLEFYKDVEKQNQELRNKQFLADANLVDLQIRLVEYEKMTQKLADSDENLKQLNQQFNDMKIKLNDQIKYKEKSETEIIRVRSEKENFEAECETLRQRITSQETLAEQLEFYKDVEKQNQELRNKQFLADGNLVDLQIRLVEYEKMTQKLADSDENLKQLNQQLNDMKIKLNDQIKYKERLETEIIRVRSEKENFEAECETLRQRITSQETLAEQLEFYKVVEKQNQELRNKQFLADANLVDLQIRLVEYEKMTQKLADSDENLKQLNQQLNDMKIKLNDQIKYKERLETEIIRVRSEKENFEAECETLRQRITSQETLAEQLEFYKDIEKQNQELRNKQFLADANLVDLQIRLFENEKVTQNLSEYIRNVLNLVDEEYNRLFTRFKSSDNENIELHKKCRELEMSLVLANDKVNRFKN